MGLRAEGVDLDQLDRRRTDGEAVEGWAYLSGRWTSGSSGEDAGGILRVERQHPAAPAPRPHPPPQVQPPCPPPAGGWPHGPTGENLRAPDSVRADPSVVSIGQARPGPTQVVLVVTTTDPDRIRARLAGHEDSRICVIASRWSRAQVDALYEHLGEHMIPWLLEGVGKGTDEEFQPLLHAEALRVVPELADWLRGVPDGLLDLKVWLTPVDEE